MKPLEILKKGLTKLQQQIRDQKTRLEGKLKAGQPLSDSDEEWLDNAGNLVDEERVGDTLDNASDYDPFAGPEPLKKTSGDDQQKVTQKPAFMKKENATLEQRIKILDWHHTNGENQSKTVKHFNAIYPNLQLKQPRISAWCKNEERWREEYEISTGSACMAKQICQTQHPEVTEMLDLWVLKAMTDRILLTGVVLRQQWRKFVDLVGVPKDEQLNLSEGWLTRYKTRTGLKEMRRHSEAALAASEAVDKECQHMRELIKEHRYQLHDIFNADESRLFYV
ncbi:hypothetical protein PAXRUDRAFT_154900 [Paxillus rubicundulus Ve08.2h10]|uniref:HTH CENPB-type domain-containing protein n=1 Tax=Paxillus rubicundulus Ve08.2h10 TaxID=930991 RepID=A0A0D0CGW9_9AGAM|nr:hypothetical protein PAXRUDRAFT_154900 [Paxillus rubicundulus Ve08.2h10]